MARRLTRLDRRSVVFGGSALAIAATSAPAASQEPQILETALRRVLGDTKPLDGRITLNVPDLSENGNTVPFDVDVASPMTSADHVRSIHIIAPANPQPDIAGYEFSPLSGRAAVSSRMRLGKSQDVYAVALMSDGKAYMTKHAVKVTIGGCGG